METQTNYEFERYICTKETLKSTIDLYGVGIIPGVLNDEECDAMVSQMWDFFEHITKQWDPQNPGLRRAHNNQNNHLYSTTHPIHTYPKKSEIFFWKIIVCST